MSICSVILDDGKRINYKNYLADVSNENVDKALCRIFPRINLNKINNIISHMDISEKRKELYADFIYERYTHVLIPALERIFQMKNLDANKTIDDSVLYSFYKDIIKPVSELDIFTPSVIPVKMPYGSKESFLNICRINKKYAIILDDDSNIKNLLPIRSNNNSLRKSYEQLNKLIPHKNKKKEYEYDR